MTNLLNKSNGASQIHLTFNDETRKKIISDFKRIVLIKGEYKDFTEAFFRQIQRYNNENKEYLDLKPNTNINKK